MLKSFFNTCAIIFVFIILIDFLFFCAWVSSNQKPVDDFYLGTITAHAAKLLI